MGWNRKSRKSYRCLWKLVVQIKVASQITGVKTDFLEKLLGRLGSHLELDQYVTPYQKYKFQMG